jgi:type I restriction enzyme S subunit
LPNITDQIRISKILSDMDLEIEVLVSKKEKYHQIKQGMMQELLTGKTRLV